MKKIFLLVLSLCSFQKFYSQNTAIDILQKKLQGSKDTSRINILNDLSSAYKEIYANTRTDTALISSRRYAHDALASSRSINYIKGIGYSLFNIAAVNSLAPENQLTTLTDYQAALPFLKQHGDTYMIVFCMEGIAESSHTIGRLKDAILYFDSVAHVLQALGDTSWSVYHISMVGHCYYDLGDYRNAYQIGNTALELAEKNSKDTGGICTALVQLANLFLGAELPQTTIEYYHKIINYYPSALSGKQDNLPWQVTVVMLRAAEAFLKLNQLDSAIFLSELMPFDTTNGDGQLFYGHLYNKQQQYQKALSFFIRGLKVETQQGHLIGMARHANELGSTYLILGNFNLAIKYADEALTTGKKIHALLEMKNAIGTLLEIYTKRKNYEQVYNYSQLYKSLNDSLSSEEYRRKLSIAGIQNELDHQKQQALLLSKENELKQQQLSKEALTRKFFLGGIIAVLLIALIIFRNNRHKHRANIALQHQKEKVESTLLELESTQAQLIQSAKMASLGELTAGIAHEIQNPLNFVNNFAEVNGDLIKELKNEVINKNLDEINSIANDIESNSEKINHHGKRAESIVRGMLQHSRKSTSIKEPTDINALADEFLRLSYHGLRAKDKSFNAEFKTDLDPTLPLINVIPQDIGRVLLNLFNNAFWAVNERRNNLINPRNKVRNQNGEDQELGSPLGVRGKENDIGFAVQPPTPKGENVSTYLPQVTLTTKNLIDSEAALAMGSSPPHHIEIRIHDNGPGIPPNIIDKIFQPFFTTKPTGQGTGLGLSLAYDIIKSHGGDIKVESVTARPDNPRLNDSVGQADGRGSGTEFIIQLPINLMK